MPHIGLQRDFVNSPLVDHPQDPTVGNTVGAKAGPTDILNEFGNDVARNPFVARCVGWGDDEAKIASSVWRTIVIQVQSKPVERDFLIDNLLVRIHYIIVMIM